MPTIRLERLRCVTLPAVLLLGFAANLSAAPNEGSAEELYQAGAAAMRGKSYAEAVLVFERAAELRPDHRKTWLGLGIAHSALKQWDEAIRAYEELIRLDPDDARAHHNLANIHFRAGDYEAAERGYRRATQLDTLYILAAFHHGWTLRQLNRPEQAEQVFRHCLEIPVWDAQGRNTRVDCLFGLGSLRHRAGDYETSAKIMQQVLSVHPTHPEARYYLGIAYRQLGDLEQAARELEFHRQMLGSRRPRLPAFDTPTDK
jgi:tetratricopeptide (TPR) repeat protein